MRSDDADMRVQIVKGFTPDQPCMWQIVPPTANPDYCVQVRAVPRATTAAVTFSSAVYPPPLPLASYVGSWSKGTPTSL